MLYIIPIFVFILGITWGSFLNVWIYRIPQGRSIAGGRSACMTCNHTLGPLDLFPVFSFLFLKGKCRYCGTKLSWQYPLVELIVGFLFLLTYFRFQESEFGLNPYLWIISIFLITVNVVIAKIDWDTALIPNSISYPSIIIAIILSFFIGGFPLAQLVPQPTFVESLIGGIAYFLLFFLIFFVSNGGMGMGDAKWSLFIGLILGWKYAFISLLFASLSSVLFSGLILLLFRKEIKKLPNIKVSIKDEEDEPIEHKVWGVSIVNGKPAVVFGPFLAAGMLFSWFYGVELLNWWLF